MSLISILRRKLIRSNSFWQEIEPDPLASISYKPKLSSYAEDPGYLEGLKNLKLNRAYQDALNYRIAQLYALMHMIPKDKEHYDRMVIGILGQIRALQWCKKDLPTIYSETKTKVED